MNEPSAEEGRYVVTHVTRPKPIVTTEYSTKSEEKPKENLYKLTAFALNHAGALEKVKSALEALGYQVHSNRKTFEADRSLRATFLFQVEEAS